MPDETTFDHIIPVVWNGRVDNLQVLCWTCNRWKSDMAIDYRPCRAQPARRVADEAHHKIDVEAMRRSWRTPVRTQ